MQLVTSYWVANSRETDRARERESERARERRERENCGLCPLCFMYARVKTCKPATCMVCTSLPVYNPLLLFVYLIVTSVRGQLTSCRASFDCNGAPGDDLGSVTDPRDCCLGNPNGVAYIPREGACIACVGES